MCIISVRSMSMSLQITVQMQGTCPNVSVFKIPCYDVTEVVQASVVLRIQKL